MHSDFYRAITEALKELSFPVYTANHVGEMGLPCVVVSANFSTNGNVLAKNWTFDANAEFRLCVPAENADGAEAAQAALDDAENELIEAIKMQDEITLNEALGDHSELYFYSGFIPEEIGGWEVSTVFSEPALEMTISGRFAIQR